MLFRSGYLFFHLIVQRQLERIFLEIDTVLRETCEHDVFRKIALIVSLESKFEREFNLEIKALMSLDAFQFFH